MWYRDVPKLTFSEKIFSFSLRPPFVIHSLTPEVVGADISLLS